MCIVVAKKHSRSYGSCISVHYFLLLLSFVGFLVGVDSRPNIALQFNFIKVATCTCSTRNGHIVKNRIIVIVMRLPFLQTTFFTSTIKKPFSDVVLGSLQR